MGFFVITRSSSPRPISDLGQALGPILESWADKSGDNEKPIIICIYVVYYDHQKIRFFSLFYL